MTYHLLTAPADSDADPIKLGAGSTEATCKHAAHIHAGGRLDWSREGDGSLYATAYGTEYCVARVQL